MVSTPNRCSSITTSLPSSPEPSSMTLIAEGLSGVPMRMAARLADSLTRRTAPRLCSILRRAQDEDWKLAFRRALHPELAEGRRASDAAIRMRLVLRLVHQLVLGDPGHHGAELGADLFDRMRCTSGTSRLERGLARPVLQHPVAREFAGLNVVEHALHLALGLRRDDAGAGDILAILRSVGD